MNQRHRTIPPEKGWDSIYSIDEYIERTRFAVMHRGQVTLIFREENGRYLGVGIEYHEGGGLHYDSDADLAVPYVGEMMEKGQADITQSWAICEKFLLAPRLSPSEQRELSAQQ
jgi:hypothetical protein